MLQLIQHAQNHRPQRRHKAARATRRHLHRIKISLKVVFAAAAVACDSCCVVGGLFMRVLLVLAMLAGSLSPAFAQVVEGVGFYREIVDNLDKDVRTIEPRRGIPNNFDISLRQLPSRMDPETGTRRKTVYVAATLASGTIPSQILFLFRRVVRPGDERCAAEQDQVSMSDKDAAKLVQSGLGRDTAAITELLLKNARDLVAGAELGVGSLKVKVVSTDPKLRTYYDYRFVHCPGQVQVWVTDNKGNVLGPSSINSGIVLPIID